MSSTQPLPPPSPLCPATNSIVAVLSSHLPLSYSFGNCDGVVEGGSADTTLYSVHPHLSPLRIFTPCFVLRLLRKFRHLCNAPPLRGAVLFWLRQYLPHHSPDNDDLPPITSPPILPIYLTQSSLPLLYLSLALSISIHTQILAPPQLLVSWRRATL